MKSKAYSVLESGRLRSKTQPATWNTLANSLGAQNLDEISAQRKGPRAIERKGHLFKRCLGTYPLTDTPENERTASPRTG